MCEKLCLVSVLNEADGKTNKINVEMYIRVKTTVNLYHLSYMRDFAYFTGKNAATTLFA